MTIQQAAIEQFRQASGRLRERAPAARGSDAERLERAKAVFRRRIDAGMAIDMECCIHCGMCAEACHFYESTGDAKYAPIHKIAPLRRFYHRELSPIRWLYALFTPDISIGDLERWQELVYDSCTECARCDLICPMGLRISPMVGVMREALAAADLMPAELAGAGREQLDDGTVLGAGPAELDAAVAKLLADGVEIPVDRDSAEVMVLTTALDLTVLPTALAAMAKIMNALGVNWTLRRSGFEASAFEYMSGDEGAQRDATRRIVEQARACGAKTVIVPECGHAYPALRWKAAERLGEPLPFEVMAVSEFIGRELAAGRLKLARAQNGGSVTYHDPCKIGRLGGVFDEPRQALGALGLELREMESHGPTQYCCGGGAGVMLIERAAPLRQRAFEIKMRQVDDTGAGAVVTSCESCRMNFAVGAANANWQTPVKSLMELVAENLA